MYLAEIALFSLNLSMGITFMMGVLLLIATHYYEVRFMALAKTTCLSYFFTC